MKSVVARVTGWPALLSVPPTRADGIRLLCSLLVRLTYKMFISSDPSLLIGHLYMERRVMATGQAATDMGEAPRP